MSRKEILLLDIIEQNKKLRDHENIARVKENEIEEARKRLHILETRLQLTK